MLDTAFEVPNVSYCWSTFPTCPLNWKNMSGFVTKLCLSSIDRKGSWIGVFGGGFYQMLCGEIAGLEPVVFFNI